MTFVYYSVTLLLLISPVLCDNVIPQNPLESQVLLLLNKWRDGHVNSSILPLPSLKSIKIPDVEYSFDRKGIQMTYMLKKMHLTGLDSFSVKKLTAMEVTKNLNMSISLNIPKLTLYAENYDLKGRAYLLYPLKGSGNMTVIFRNTDLKFKIRFVATNNGIGTRIGDFQFDFKVHQIEANLMDSPWPINKVLNSEGVEILASYHDDIVRAMWDYVVPYVDGHLVDITIPQIVNYLLNTNL